MAQHDYSIANQSGASFRSDLNNALSAIVSQNSGTAEPSTTYAYQMWADTTNGVMKLRNAANNAWITLYQLDGEWSVIPFENGSAAAPSIYFKDSGTDTGFFSAGTDQVNVTTGGTERVEWGTSEVVFNDVGGNYDFRVEGDTNANLLFVDASADAVGIGTSLPQELFNVSTASVSDATLIRLDGGAGIRQRFFPSSGTGKFNWQIAAQSNVDNGFEITPSSTSGGSTFSTPAVVVKSNGNVGIGDNAPGSRLSVYGSTGGIFKFQGDTTGNGYGYFLNSSGTGIGYLGNGGGGALGGGTANDFVVRGEANLLLAIGNSEKARIDSSGRLLVGTSSTANENAQLQIQSSGAYGAQFFYSAANSAGSYLALSKSRGTAGSPSGISSGDGQGAIVFKGYAGSGWVDGAYIEAITDGTPGTNDLPTRLVFSVTSDGASSPTERMRISNDGEIETYSTDNNLTLRSSQAAGTTYNFIAGLYGASSTTSGGTVSFVVRNNGDVRNTNGTYSTVSDLKLKENVVDAASQWDDIKAIQIRNWNFKKETGYETHRQIGPIAQELEAVCPNLVIESADIDDEGNDLGTVTKSVNQSVLYMKAVKALQEAMERIETLEAKVAALESA